MLRVRTVFSGVQGAPWLSTFYFQATTEGQTEASAAVTATGAFWTSVKARMGTQISYATQAQVDGIDVNGGHTGAWNTTPATGTGSLAGNLLPPAVQGLVQWRTGTYVNNREVRGRTFLPGLTTASNSSLGAFDTATATPVQTAINTLLGNATVHLSVWDRTHAGAATVVSGACWGQFAVLRSRRD
jgi:hypothetical protein